MQRALFILCCLIAFANYIGTVLAYNMNAWPQYTCPRQQCLLQLFMSSVIIIQNRNKITVINMLVQ